MLVGHASAIHSYILPTENRYISSELSGFKDVLATQPLEEFTLYLIVNLFFIHQQFYSLLLVSIITFYFFVKIMKMQEKKYFGYNVCHNFKCSIVLKAYQQTKVTYWPKLTVGHRLQYCHKPTLGCPLDVTRPNTITRKPH